MAVTACEAIALSEESAHLAIQVAGSATSGRVAVLDLTSGAPAHHWKAWVEDPSLALLELLDADARRSQAPRTVVVVRVPSAPPDSAARAAADAAVESLRGIVGCAVLERAASGFRANTLVINDRSSQSDVADVAGHLLDDRASGFSDGATVQLTHRPTAVGHRRTRPRRVLITGAASGIGLETARRFVGAGYEALLTDVDSGALETVAHQLGAVAVAGDARDTEQLLESLEPHISNGLDALIIVHGVAIAGTFGELDRSVVQRGIDINASSVERLIRRLTPRLVERTGGSIAIVSSANGIESSCCGTSVYSASKFALVGYARGMRDSLAEEGVTINLLCPGWIDTPFHVKNDYAEGAQREGAATPVGRIGTAAEMADGLLLLAELDATGVLYAPTGGLVRT